ncbi:MAG: HAMP domain-containing methyl-accepting chemotaxis protein [Hydrogenovibrio sp.]
MAWFNDLKIRTKLILFVILMLTALAISGFNAIRGFALWSDGMTKFADERLPGAVALGNLNTERMAIRAQTVSVLQYDNVANSRQQLQAIIDERNASWKAIDENWNRFAEIPKRTQNGMAFYNQLKNEYQAWRNIYVELDGLIQKLIQTDSQVTYDIAMANYEDAVQRMIPISNTMGKTFTDYTGHNIKVTTQQANQASQDAKSKQAGMVLTLVVAIILAILFGYVIVRASTYPLNRMVNVLRKIDQTGDFSLTIDHDSKDEVGDAAKALNNLMSNLKKALNNTNQVVHALSQGDFSQRIEGDYSGDLAQLQEGVNDSADSINTTMQQLSKVMNSLKAGEFSVKIDTDLPGDFGAMMRNAAVSMDALNQAIGDAINVMDNMQKGQFNHRVQVNVSGALQMLKTAINHSMDALAMAIEDISNVVVAQSEGDLTQTITNNYEGQLLVLKNAINKTATSLNEIVSVAMNAASAVNHAAAEVAQGSMDLSDRVQNQAAAVEQSSATMEEFSAAVQNNAQNSADATEVERKVEQKAKQASEVMHQTIEAMSAIQESSHKISDIVTLIDGIAFQTNLLALNAAVEAARAGEHGRGFAVVAGEVRALAQKSADAAKEITGLINESVTRIDQGTKLASESGEVISEITESIEQAAQMSAQISQASNEQAEGVKQLQAAISQLDQGIQQNAALVEETTAAAESMREQSDTLTDRMAFFNTTNSGRSHGAPRQAPKPAAQKAAAPSLPAPQKNVTKPAAKKPESESAKPAPQTESDEWSDF